MSRIGKVGEDKRQEDTTNTLSFCPGGTIGVHSSEEDQEETAINLPCLLSPGTSRGKSKQIMIIEKPSQEVVVRAFMPFPDHILFFPECGIISPAFFHGGDANESI